MKIVFMGTPEFAVYSLEALLAEHEVCVVVTQPDKPRGRGKKVTFSPVKEKAVSAGIPVLQPSKVKTSKFANELSSFNADIFVVVAYGRILPGHILNIPRYGAINVHASLLPKYRGAAPIQWAIINGESKTGITIQQMDEGIDTGDIILVEEIPIAGDDTASSLHDKLARLGAQALLAAIKLIESGKAQHKPQDENMACYAPMIDKNTGRIDWNKNSKEIMNLIRGLNPYPAASTFYNGAPLKLYAAEETEASGNPGEISISHSGEIIVKTKDSGICIKEMQKTGGKRMDSASFQRGNHLVPGSVLL